MRAQLDRSSWWYRTRNQIIVSQISEVSRKFTIWDIGCGTGVVSSALMRDGRTMVGVEPSHAGATIASNTGMPTFQATLDKLSLPATSIDAVSMFDVLEHIEDRGQMLREVHRVLRPGGVIILTVPALPLLWSQFDIDERHYIRYSKRSLVSELVATGFRITKVRYFFALTVLPLALLRALPYRLGVGIVLTDRAGVAASGGLPGRLASRVELGLARWTPVGSSLLAIATRDD